VRRPIESTEAGEDRGRFAFGENWRRFARELPPQRIDAACASLIEMLGEPSLEGLSFLDAGSGSGLFSLAAARMGAAQIHSFDYDDASVTTTNALKERFAPDADWTVEGASALDTAHMTSLGTWDVVYSWGVLHHTGDLWRGLELICERVAPGGRMFISIYNDQGRKSRIWRAVKRLYSRMPPSLRRPYVALTALPIEARVFARHTLDGHPGKYLKLWRGGTRQERGMSRWHDLVDWIGGYPFEVAKPERVFEFCTERGFELRRLRTVGGSHGCNEFVFERTTATTGG
jgi:2-polyprenyl-3-methyl-5-hydroxy-6-metoxy-1,4-benzoquinol methylase